MIATLSSVNDMTPTAITIEQLRAALPPFGSLSKLTKKSTKEFAGPCPLCGGTDRFFVHDGMGFCRDCDLKGGDLIDWHCKIEGLDLAGLMKKYGISSNGDNPFVERWNRARAADPDRHSMEYLHARKIGAILKYLRKHYLIGFEPGHLVFPGRDAAGNLIGLQTKPVFKGPKAQFVKGSSGRNMIYHLPGDDSEGPTVITEAVIDAISAKIATRFSAVATYSASTTDKLKSINIIDPVLFFDADHAGLKATAKALQLYPHARAVDWSMAPDFKDINDLLKAERIDLIYRMIKEAKQPEGGQRGPQGITAAALICKVFPELMWVVCGVLSAGLWILAGKPKHGKSILAANIGVALSIGGRALGAISVDIGTVIYLALEDTQRRLQRRLQQMLSHGDRATDKLIFFTEWPRMDQGGLELLEEELKCHQDTRLIIIDTWKLFRPATRDSRKNLYDVDYETVSPVKKLADKYNICILLIHHFRKSDSDDIFDTFSGSYGLTGAADGLLGLQRSSAGQADAILHVTGRDVEPAEYALKFVPEFLSWNLVGKADEVATTAEQQMVLEVLKNATDSLAPKDIADKLGITAKYIKKTLPKLIKMGAVQKEGYGKYKYVGTVETLGTVGTLGTLEKDKRQEPPLNFKESPPSLLGGDLLV
jgi:hypothetical protein